MRTRSGRIGLTGLHGERYSWVYWAATVAGFALLIVDIFDDSAYGATAWLCASSSPSRCARAEFGDGAPRRLRMNTRRATHR